MVLLIDNSHLDHVAFTDMKLGEEITDGTVYLRDYALVRADCSINRQTGSVAIYVLSLTHSKGQRFSVDRQIC